MMSFMFEYPTKCCNTPPIDTVIFALRVSYCYLTTNEEKPRLYRGENKFNLMT